MRKYYVHTLGCKVNFYESCMMEGHLSARGFERTLDPKDADILVLNTCAVTSEAARKSRQSLSSLRKKNPGATFGVCGCASQEDGEAFLHLGADIVLGTYGKSLLIDRLVDKKPSDDAYIFKPEGKNTSYEEAPASYSERARAYLKIQDGCNAYCAYCLVPYLRGHSRSRNPRRVIEEAKALAEKGFHEIVITGIHIGMYGIDLSPRIVLGDLLGMLFEALPSDVRVRLGSIEVSEVDDKILALLKKEPRLASHFHMPLQSGSDSVLRRMGRPYLTKEYLDNCAKLRQARPDIAIAADIIAGFPGETEEEWKATMDFVRKAKLAFVHAFPYSIRKGTKAEKMKDQVPSIIKKARVKELISLAKELGEEYRISLAGKPTMVLLEEEIAPGIYEGTTSEFLTLRTSGEPNSRGHLILGKYPDLIKNSDKFCA